MPSFKDDEQATHGGSYRAEDDMSRTFTPPLQGTGFGVAPVNEGDPRQPINPEMRAAPGVGTALRHGARESLRGTAGLVDLVAQGVDFVSPYGDEGWGFGDKATGIGASDFATARTESMAPAGYSPQTQAEKIASVVANAGTSFAVPGAAGFGIVRGAPALARGGAAGYRKAATSDVGEHAARLAAANLGGSAATQVAEEYAPDSPYAGMLAGMVGGITGDVGAGRTVRSMANQPARTAAQAVEGARPTKRLGRLVDGIARRMRTGMNDNSFTDSDVLEARDQIMEVLFGRVNRITDAELEKTLSTQGMHAHRQLETRKKIMDEVFREIEHYATLYDAGVATPSLLGILRGADLAHGDQTRLARLQAGGQYNQQLASAARNATDDVIRDANELLPPGATGEAASVRAAALDSARESRDAVSAPYQKPTDGQSRMREILDGGGLVEPSDIRLRPQDINRVFKESMKGMELTNVGENAVSGVRKKVDELLEGAADENGRIPLFEYDGLRQELGRYARDIGTPDTEKVFIQTLMEKMDNQIENRLKRGSRELFEEYISVRRDYADHKATYGQKLTASDRARLDPSSRELETGVAKALGAASKKAKEETAELSTANDLLSLANVHGPSEVASQVRKVMQDDVARMQEVEATLWNRIFGEAINPESTHAQVRGKQRELAGPAFKEGESNLLGLYRELAGNEKADAVADLIKRARSARADDTFSFEEAYRTNSGTLATMEAGNIAGVMDAAGDVVSGRPSSFIRKIATGAMARFSDDISEQRVANAIQMAQLNPRALLDLLSAPSKKDFASWEAKWIGKPAKTGGREAARSGVADEIGE